MKPFEYHEPKSTAEAVGLLSKLGPSAKILAGGTDLIIQMEQRTCRPRHVLNVMRIPELQGVSGRAGMITIGSATSLRQVETSPLLRDKTPVLCEAVSTIGSIQIRNLATVGGNLCNAAPSADAAPPLLILEARVRIVGPQGERDLPLKEFFKGPRQTALQADELLVAIEIPEPPRGFRGIYYKQSPRYAMDIAIVGVAIGVLRSNGKCDEARISLGAVAPTPLRVAEAEAILKGNSPEERLVNTAAAISREAAKPISDIRASADYRRAMVETLVRRGLNALLSN